MDIGCPAHCVRDRREVVQGDDVRVRRWIIRVEESVAVDVLTVQPVIALVLRTAADPQVHPVVALIEHEAPGAGRKLFIQNTVLIQVFPDGSELQVHGEVASRIDIEGAVQERNTLHL